MQVRPGEPVYAQVNREKKRSRGGADESPGGYPPDGRYHDGDYSDHGLHWSVNDQSGHQLDTSGQGQGQNSAGDSWV